MALYVHAAYIIVFLCTRNYNNFVPMIYKKTRNRLKRIWTRSHLHIIRAVKNLELNIKSNQKPIYTTDGYTAVVLLQGLKFKTCINVENFQYFS